MPFSENNYCVVLTVNTILFEHFLYFYSVSRGFRVTPTLDPWFEPIENSILNESKLIV